MRKKRCSYCNDVETVVNTETDTIYGAALDYFKVVQEQQIEKGRAKYPEDLNPENWTAEQLIDHAMQEAVDQIHYLTALRVKLIK